MERNFPWECQNPFLLISKDDLTRLFYCGNPRNPFRWLPSIRPDHNHSHANASWAVTSGHRRTITCCHVVNFPRDIHQGRGGIVPSAFQQTAWPYRKRSLVTAICILPAERFLLTLLARRTKGKFSGKIPQGRTIPAPLREGETMPQRRPQLQ